MYIPKNYQTTDRAEIVAFMQRHSFAAIITAKDQLPVATHLPFVVTRQDDDTIRLISHFARANPQWQQVAAFPVLVVFSEPHAYVSPSHYDSEQSVPTWNYFAVHAYGQGRLLTEPAQTLGVLEATIATYEASYQQQWEQLPAEFKTNMARGIVAFEITVTELQAQKKMSQNKSAAEQQRIIHTLTASKDGAARELAHYMQLNQL
ncbi:FMN-binding negative transcriptional regulator [Hymenobacter volaticus]|uniref:FMN-binding negative transcriptional regulator n=1 Tax=Hymenobacter volaticus TaxID=2932254 RepID=A0ABY4GH18_9BACT|nr:FMN-binding negative transcriptional regulator [Hymenobacter volaticus]UOQ69739.1 FMN-binding negative transcriptional regulator [Hymenobacter volaticus]